VGNPDELNFEIQKAAWFSLDELPEQLPKDQVALIRRVLKDGAKPQD
jgi:NADH pyrophosphatase NudC (nudix superfamily)